MTEYEMIQVLGHLLDERLEHVAKKTDIVELGAEIKSVHVSLSTHLVQHEKRRAFINKVKIIAVGSVITGLISVGLRWAL